MKRILFLLLLSSTLYAQENSIFAKMAVNPISRSHIAYKLFPGAVSYDKNIDFKRTTCLSSEMDHSIQDDITVIKGFFTDVKPGVYRFLQDGQCSGTVVTFNKDVTIRMGSLSTCDVFEKDNNGSFNFLVTLSTN